MKEHHLDVGYSVWGDDTSTSPDNTTVGIDLYTVGDAPFSEVKATAEDMPFREDSMSSVWIGHTMIPGGSKEGYYEYADIDKTLNEASRVIKPGGKIFTRVAEEDHDHVIRKLKSLGFSITDDYHETDENYIRATKRR